jgi:ribose transport system permease protein
VAAFAAAGFLAGIAGVLASATLGAGNPNVGPPLLLAAFAAAFLGATSIKPGSYNVLGTLFGVFTVATGVTGLQLMGVAFYIEPIFQGGALIIAVAATRYLRREAL